MQANPVLPIRPRRIVLPIEQVLPVVRVAHRRDHLAHAWRQIVDHELILILDGHGELRRPDGVWPLSPGTVAVIPPFMPHALASFSGDRGSHLAVHCDLALGVPDDGRDPRRRRPYRVEVSGVPPLPPVHSGDAEVERRFITVLRAFTLGTAAGRWEASLAVARMLQAMWSVAAPLLDEVMTAVCATARERLAEGFEVADLARLADLSPSRLRARFLAATGLAPRDWLARLRIERARSLLADSGLPLAEVAITCGFADAYHLSHAFSRLTGESPSAFRAAVAAGRMWQAI